MTDALGSLRIEPIPLYSPELKLAVLWSAKAGSTFAVKWFFYQAGLLETAYACDPWIHDYRAKVYCAGPGYRENISVILSDKVRVVKFVRNPMDRAVSAYLSLCRGLLSSRPNLSIDRAHIDIGRVLGRTLSSTSGFTFREFVRFLRHRGVNGPNMHWRLQVSPVEAAGLFPNLVVIRIEEIASVLGGVEDRLGLGRSPHEVLSMSVHRTNRQPTDSFCGDQIVKQQGMRAPATNAFYDEELDREVRALYRDDFDRYGY